MPTITVGVGETQTINTSETDTVTFLGLGTLNVSGTTSAPITVNLTQLAGVTGLLDTINITNAAVTLSGLAGVSALTAFNIGAGGRLNLASVANLQLGSIINFSGQNSVLGLGAGLGLGVLTGVSGFAPGSAIDVSQVAGSVTYADASGTNTGGVLTIRDTAGSPIDTVPLTTGEYTAASFTLTPDGTGGTFVSFVPTITDVTATPATADLGVGGTATLALTPSVPVTVAGGTPTLALNDGGTATYNPGASTPTNLVFTYTVAAGQNTPDLAVTGVNLNGASVTDGFGASTNLSGAVANPAGILQVDTTAPTVTGITATPANGDLGVGGTATITLTPSEAVTVAGGTPTLALNDGGTATYNPGASTPTNLVFTYTVAAGQNTPDLAVTGVALNGAAVTDAAGNAANLSGAVANPSGTLQVDTTAPTVAAVTTSPASGTVALGQAVAITVTPTEPVTVAGGTPTLTLSDGGTATYNPGASTPTSLVFTTTVAAGQNTPDLAVTAVNTNGATVKDAAGNAANLSGAVVNPPGVLTVNSTLPGVTGVTASPANADLGVGATATITVMTSKPVSVTGGTPTLALNDGGTATYNPGASTPTNLVFTYTVAVGQNTPDLAVTGAGVNGATIADALGNALDLGAAAVNPAGTLQVDTTVATVAGVTATPANGDLGVGGTATITVATTKPVTVAGGTPTLALNDGGTATYNPGASTPTNLVFTYTVAAGQNTPDLAVTGVVLNGATVTDAAGNAANLAGSVLNPAGTLQVDTTAPTVARVSTSPGSGTVGLGQTVAITVTPTEPVTVAGGTPTLTLSDGGTATYNPGPSTPTNLVFTTTVAVGQNTPDLAVTAVNPNGATIADAAGNTANLAGAVVNPPGVLAVDSTVPTVTGVTAAPANGDLGVGATATITVATTKPVTVAGGTPTLTLNDGGTATYNPGASTPTNLVFTTTVAAGQNTPDLAVTGIALNGATVADAAGNAANLAGAVVNPPGTLQVDTTAPTVAAITTSPASGTLGTGQTVAITVTPTEPVTVAGGMPTLALNDGGTATYSPTASTPTSLVFTTTVAAGQNTPDLAVTGVALNGATIADGAGNPANLSGAVVNPPGVLAVDATLPTITGVTATPPNGDLGVGATATITVATSKPVSVTGGTPTLALNDGGTATYNPGASTPTNLVFTTTVAAGQSTPDLAVTGFALNGATIADALGNALDLGAAAVNPPGNLQVDGIVPVISGISSNPGSGTVGAGQTVAITVTPSEPVTVAGGTPTLTLNDGDTATYNPGASTPTSLVFTTTTAAGQNAASLGVTGANLNGATITDAADNPASLSGAVATLGLGVDTAPPTVTGVSLSVTITVSTSEPVTVTGGPPTVTLNNGGTATYNPGASTPTSLTFTYTPAAGDDTSGLAVTGIALNGGSITDAAGNAANLSGATTAAGSGPVVNTGFHPFLPVVASSADPAATVTVSVATRPFIAGTYSNLGTGTIGADGATYTVSGTTAQVNAALAGVILTPAKGSAGITGYTGNVADASAAQSGLTVTGNLANVLSPTTAGDAVTAGLGNDTLLGGAAGGTLLVGGAGRDVLVGSTGGGTLIGGTGSSTFFSEGGATRVVGNGANDVISAPAGNATVVSATGGHSLIGLGDGTELVNGQGTDTLIGGSGALTAGIAANSLASLGSGPATISAAQGSTVIGGSGMDFVGVRGSGILFFAGSGPALFIGGTGSSTVVGGTGSHSTILGAAGGGLLSGGTGGGNTIVGGLQATTVFGGGAGDVLFAEGSGGTLIQAGSGNETVEGVGSSGNDTFFLGSGPDLVGLGSGRDVVFAGTGSSTVVAGAGQDVFAFARGRAGGAQSIIGFKAGTDVVSLQGYGAGEASSAAASATVTPATPTTAVSTTITLSDNSRITFLGLGSLPGNLFG